MNGKSLIFIKGVFIVFSALTHTLTAPQHRCQKGILCRALPQPIPFSGHFSLFLGVSILCALLGLTSAPVVRGKIYFHNFLCRVFHRRCIVPSEIFTRAVEEARNLPPEILSHFFKIIDSEKKRKTYNHFS